MPPTGTTTATLLHSISTSWPLSRPLARIPLEHTTRGSSPKQRLADLWTTRIALYRNQRRRGVSGEQHRRANNKKKQIQCWAECDLMELIWLLLLACAVGSGLSVGVFYIQVQRQEHQSSTTTTRSLRAIIPPPSPSSKAPDSIKHQHLFNPSSARTALVVKDRSTALASAVETSNHTEVAVFYNVFASNNLFDMITATDVRPFIREQLGQIAASFSPSSDVPTPTPPTIYYTTIGKKSDVAIAQACTTLDLTCRHLQHFPVASETATLTRLHEYCQKYPTHSVVYLHNKGSLHHSKSQDRWRQALTQSATSWDCRAGMSAAPFQCNVCGLLFQPLPASHFPGNMWSATCHYVRQLLPPDKYHELRPAVDEWIRREQNAFLFRPESHFVGKKRYEAEHWIGSHPTLRPCDVSTSPNLDDWKRGDRSSSSLVSRPALQLQRAPRTGLDDRRWIFYRYMDRNETLSEPHLRLRDYFLLRGIIYRWMVFYQTVAYADSWVWHWYPDGRHWRAALADAQDDPLRALQVMTNASGSAVIVRPRPTLTHRLLQAGNVALYWMDPRSGGGLFNDRAIIYDPF